MQYRAHARALAMASMRGVDRSQFSGISDDTQRAEAVRLVATDRAVDIMLGNRVALEWLTAKCCIIGFELGTKPRHILPRVRELVGGAYTSVCDLDALTEITDDHATLGLDISDLIDSIQSGLDPEEKKQSRGPLLSGSTDSTTRVTPDAK